MILDIPFGNRVNSNLMTGPWTFFLGEPFARGFLAGIQFSHCDICLVTVFTHGGVLHSDDADSGTLCDVFYREALCVAQDTQKCKARPVHFSVLRRSCISWAVMSCPYN